MEELESQIAKIQLGNGKHANNFVFVFAEKAGSGNAEIYMVAELPLLNPAAGESCEKICLAIASALKRVYRRPLGESSFENAISQINEELGKLASLGQTHWIDKLNCILAVKQGFLLTIATCGKVAALLLRNGEFTDISCSAPQSHPLKTFENYATGKIRLSDLLILSTSQIFNYLSMDRLRAILSDTQFLAATQNIIGILKANAGPEVAFGALLNLQVPLGQASDDEINLEDYAVEAAPAQKSHWWLTAWGLVKSSLLLDKTRRVPSIGLPHPASWPKKIKNWAGSAASLASRGKTAVAVLARSASESGKNANLQNFRQFSPQKKFFFFSAAILLIAFIANVAVTSHLKKVKSAGQKITDNLQNVQSLVSNAQGSLLYKDNAKAQDFLAQAQKALPKPGGLAGNNKRLYDTLLAQISDVQTKLEKVAEPKVKVLGSLGAAERLINLPQFLAVQVNGNIISYNKATGRIEDGVLKSASPFADQVFTGGGNSVIYDGKALLYANLQTGELKAGTSQNIPANADFGGMEFYPPNQRVYLLNKKTSQIVSFLASDSRGLLRPVVAVNNSALASAQNFAIDGNIYVLTAAGISKYQSGKAIDFRMPGLLTPFSGSGKIYTEKDFNNLYLLDTGNNRIIIIKKNGSLVAILKHPAFTRLKDLAVEEKNKIIYLLNDGSLLKVNF